MEKIVITLLLSIWVQKYSSTENFMVTGKTCATWKHVLLWIVHVWFDFSLVIHHVLCCWKLSMHCTDCVQIAWASS